MPNPTVSAADTGLPDNKTRDIAAMDFRPWERTPGEWTPPTNEEWAELVNPHLVTVRAAWLMLHKTKPDLMEFVDKIDNETGQALMDGFVGTIGWLKGLLAILENAEARILCAGAAVIERDDARKGGAS